MIVIARKYGQLGNRLFLYAHLIAAARHYGVPLLNPSFSEYASLFPRTRSDLWCRYDAGLELDHNTRSTLAVEPRPWQRRAVTRGVHVAAKTIDLVGVRNRRLNVIRLRSGEECDLLSERFRDAVLAGGTLLLHGWLFRSGSLLKEHWSPIRDFFSLADVDQSAIDRVLQDARRESDLVVGVHIRRGDYATFQGGRYCFGDNQYARWMHEIREQMPGSRVKFLVCSHERLDEKQYAGLRITRGPGTALQDMYALAQADWMIGPPSTFTAWASFINQRPLVAMHSADQTLIVPDSVATPAAA